MTANGQHRTLGVSDDLDHVIAVARVGGGDLQVSRSTDGPENGSMTICPVFTLASRERLNVKNRWVFGTRAQVFKAIPADNRVFGHPQSRN